MFIGWLVLVVGVFMVLLGLSLLTELKVLNKIKIHTPAFIAKYLYHNKKSKKPHGPFVIGLFTAFMPCGPLQAMQIYALSTGSFLQGGMAMFAYALGTFPLRK